MFAEVHDDDIRSRAASGEIAALLSIYEAARPAQDALPTYDSFNPSRLDAFRRQLIVAMPVGDGLVYTYFGEGVSVVTGIDKHGRPMREDDGCPLNAFFADTAERALDQGRPLFTLHRSLRSPRVHLWERLVLPVRIAGGRVGVVIMSVPRPFEDDLLAAVMGASMDGIIATSAIRDADGTIVDARIEVANVRAGELIGREATTLVGDTMLQTFPDLIERGLWAAQCAVMTSGQPRSLDAAYRIGEVDRWFRVNLTPLREGLLITYADVTDLKNALAQIERERTEFRYASEVMEQQASELSGIVADAELARAQLADEVAKRQGLEHELVRIAREDQLTGVFNRHGFDELARRLYEQSRRSGAPLSAVVIDVDHFKRINDTYGHAGGDSVLAHIGATLKRSLRTDVDVVGRIGGEEFVLMLPNTDGAGAALLAERLRTAFAAVPVLFDGQLIRVTASFGVAEFAAGDDGHAALVRRADSALYVAKNEGRNRVVQATAARAPAAPRPVGVAA